MKTLNPSLESGGTSVALFREIYRVAAPMVEVALSGDYSVLPVQFQGPTAFDSFHVPRPLDVKNAREGGGH
jgi:hypothetical protein